MVRRKKSQSLVSDSTFSAILVLVVVMLLVPWIWRIVIILTLIVAVLIYLHFYYRRLQKLRTSGLLEIDRMDGPEFEKKLWLVFRDLGYKVEATPVRGDWGADLIISKDSVRTVVQAKRYSKPVGLKAVQEAVAARAKYNCTRSIVITNSTFTAQARELAFSNGTDLWDRDHLLKLLEEASISQQV